MRYTSVKKSGLSDKEVFVSFVRETKALFEERGLKLGVIHDRVLITCEEGVVEVFHYDRPTNPRFEGDIFKFDWEFVNEKRVVNIRPRA